MFFENIKIRLKSGRTLTGLRDRSDGLLPLPQKAVGLVLSTDIGGWTSLCSVKRKRPFPPCVRGWNLPDRKQDGLVRCRSPAYQVWIRLQNYGDFTGCGIGTNRHLQPVHRHLQPTEATAIESLKKQCSFASTNRVINTLTMRVWTHSEHQQTEYAMHRNISVSVLWVTHAIMNALTHEHINTLRTGLLKQSNVGCTEMSER